MASSRNTITDFLHKHSVWMKSFQHLILWSDLQLSYSFVIFIKSWEINCGKGVCVTRLQIAVLVYNKSFNKLYRNYCLLLPFVMITVAHKWYMLHSPKDVFKRVNYKEVISTNSCMQHTLTWTWTVVSF